LIDEIGRLESERNKIKDAWPQLFDHSSNNEAENNRVDKELLQLPQSIEMTALNLEDGQFYGALVGTFIDAVARQTEELRSQQQHLVAVVQRRTESLTALQKVVHILEESIQSWRLTAPKLTKS
jgi:hypothetical protein